MRDRPGVGLVELPAAIAPDTAVPTGGEVEVPRSFGDGPVGQELSLLTHQLDS